MTTVLLRKENENRANFGICDTCCQINDIFLLVFGAKSSEVRIGSRKRFFSITHKHWLQSGKLRIVNLQKKELAGNENFDENCHSYAVYFHR